MSGCLSSTVNAELIARIQMLKSDKHAKWGKINTGQMLAHCQVPIRVAAGELKLKRGLIGFLFSAMAKKKILHRDKGFGFLPGYKIWSFIC